MRLLMITADFPPSVGGMQVYSWELAQAWAPLVTALSVIAPRHPQSTETDSNAPFEVRRVAYAKDSFAFSGVPPVRRAIAAMQPDAIFATSWSCASGALQAQRFGRTKVPVFAAAHGRELILRPLEHVRGLPLQRAYDMLRHTSLAACRRLFPVSQFTAGLLREHGVREDNIEVVNNGVDSSAYVPRDASALRERLGLTGKKVLLTIGRLVARKGIDDVLQVLPTLVHAHPDLVYAIVGDGPDRARIEALVAASGVSAHVRLLGRVGVTELVDYYNLCDVFVMPSRSDATDVEGFGIVFFEASACGKPVVGARSGGVPDAVVDNETGFLIDPGNLHDLTRVLLDLLGDPDRAKQIGEQGRRHVLANGTWARSARQIYQAMQQHVNE